MYKWNADDYQKNSEAQLNWGRELIAKLGLHGKEHILDIGCGDGKVTADIAAHVPDGRVVGIDSSSDMIDLACKTFPANDFPNLRFFQMDARELTCSNEFDIIFSNAVLHWIDDHRKVLSGIYKGLKTPGKILLQMGGRGNVAGMMAVMRSMTEKAQWKAYFSGFVSPYNFYGPDEYSAWLSEMHFKPVRLELIPKDMTQQGREGFIGWIRTTWHPFIHRVPESEQQEFIRQAVDSYLTNHPMDREGLVHIDVVRLEVEAIK
ncbi:MAG: methyltransferase domain-containing protein [Dehalococcoidia bacterium]|jgi:trans-aconitate methyltransferase